MGKLMFNALVEILSRDPAFHSTGRRPQRPVCIQLTCFLIRYGFMGSNAMLPAMLLALGAGTVILYCTRITRAQNSAIITYAGLTRSARKQSAEVSRSFVVFKIVSAVLMVH